MTEAVERFEPTSFGGGTMDPSPSGDWVRYDDYETQAAEIASLREELREAREHGGRFVLRAEAAEANARRYLFIRDDDAFVNVVFAELPDESGYRFKRGDELDDAVDAMRGGAE